MGRVATKAQGNVWYKARMEAGKWNDRLLSRSGAAELMSMSEDAVKNTELGLEKCMPVDKAVLMADLYHAPELLNYYCLHECPIGCNHNISDLSVGIDRLTVKLMKELQFKDLKRIKAKLLEIAEDGDVCDEEMEELEEVVKYLSEIAVTVSELRTFFKKRMNRDV